MTLPALRLDGYFYERVSLGANPTWPANESPVTGVNVKVEVGQHKNEPTRWRVIMDLVTQPDREGRPIPYNVALRCHGFFTVEASEDLQIEARTLVQITGASMLYSAARDMVLTLSSRSRFGAVVLPTVSFQKPDAATPQEPHKQGKPRGSMARPTRASQAPKRAKKS